MTSSGDSTYLSEARKIQNNLLQLQEITKNLRNPNGGKFDSLSDARTIAVDTHKLLKGFGSITVADCYGTEKFKSQYQAVLKAIDAAAQSSLQQQTCESYPVSTCDSDYSRDSYASKKRSSRASQRQYEQQRNNSDQDHHQYFPPIMAADMTSQRPQPISVPTRPIVDCPPEPEPSQAARNFQVEMIQHNAGSGASSVLTKEERECFLLTREGHESTVWESKRHQSALQIEKDVRGIRELYNEMAWQVSNNNDDFDALESQMRSAASFSAQSTTDLRLTDQMLRYRRRALIIVACIGVTCSVVWFIMKILTWWI